MKKALAFILAVLYLSTSMGATIHLHYCMGRLASWGLLDHSSNACSFCGMLKKTAGKQCTAMQKKCCRDEHKHIRNNDVHKAETNLSGLTGIAAFVADVPPVARPEIWSRVSFLNVPVANGPPVIATVPVFLLHRNFRI